MLEVVCASLTSTYLATPSIQPWSNLTATVQESTLAYLQAMPYVTSGIRFYRPGVPLEALRSCHASGKRKASIPPTVAVSTITKMLVPHSEHKYRYSIIYPKCSSA